ncbi:MAG: L,D-transpeptidase family protein [Methylophaga sp.]|nr:L,D-transpeptidase family protein [Methylophaga sp.]
MKILKKTAVAINFLLLFICLPVNAMVSEWLEHSQQENTYDLDLVILSHFYNDKSAYLWLDKQQPSSQAHDAIDFISASSRQGLNPEDYHSLTLKQLDPTDSTIAAHQFDVLLTDGLLKLIHDLSVGRLKASEADPDWFIPQAEFDAKLFLKQSLLTNQLRAQLDSLIPISPEYISLIGALARYQSYVARGGWSQIPKTSSIRPGDSHQQLPAIRARLAFEDSHIPLSADSQSLIYDAQTEQAVRHFQEIHGLKVDGVIGKGTRRAMNISASDRTQQIKVALERRRWMPNELGQQHLFINLANYTLSAVEDGNEKLNMRVIVGREKRQTPSFVSQMNRVVVNPYWNVPRKLAVKDLLPKQQEDFNYFYTHDIRVFTRENGQKVEHDSYLIDWHALNEDNFPYTLRQDPGDHNALGQIKFLFPNDWAIYLHDTNHKKLFNESMRSLSSGCIRVEDPIALANFSLADRYQPKTILEMIESKENRGRKVTKSLSVYAVYFTVWMDDNEVKFSPDVYQRDERMAKHL